MSQHLFEYDTNYFPSAPVMEVEIEGDGKQRQRILRTALIDSGADNTMIPRNILRQVGARFWGSSRMRGVSGKSNKVDLYSVMIQIGNQPMQVQAIASPAGSEFILGRDVLNRLKIT